MNDAKINKNILQIYLFAVFVLVLAQIQFFYFADGDGIPPYSNFMLIFSLVFVSLFVFFRNKIILLTTIWLYVLITYINILYYRNYTTFIPFSSYQMKISDLHFLSISTFHSIKYYDILFFLPVSFFTMHGWKKAKPYCSQFTFVSIGGLLLALILFLTLDLPRMAVICRNFQYGMYWDRYAGTLTYGYPGYVIYETFYHKDRIYLSEEEKASIDAYLKEKYLVASSHIPERNKSIDNKNVILILVESLETFPLNMTLNNHEITPFFNSLCRDSSILYIPQIISQVSGGRSSDAQLLYNTGLFPLKHGAACHLNGIKYKSIVSALKEERNFNDCITIHSYSPSFWNQTLFSEMLGYDKTYSDCDFNDYEYIGKSISDKSLVDQSVPIITSLKQPFFVQFITASSHDPIDIEEQKTFDLSETIDKPTAYYLEIINYVDRTIQSFFDSLNENNLLENTIIIITGDHSSGYEEDGNSKYFVKLRDEKRFVPLIVYGAEISYKYDEEIGQVDVYPTLLDLFELKTNWRGLGCSIFEQDTIENAEHSSKKSHETIDIHQISDWIIRGDYFNLDASK